MSELSDTMSEHNDKIDRLDERLTRVEDKIDGLTSGVQQIIAMLSRLSDGG